MAGLPCDSPIKCSRDVVIKPDTCTKDAISKAPYDAIVLPGGLGGAKAQCESAELGQLLKEQEKAGRIVAAICAGEYSVTHPGVVRFWVVAGNKFHFGLIAYNDLHGPIQHVRIALKQSIVILKEPFLHVESVMRTTRRQGSGGLPL